MQILPTPTPPFIPATQTDAIMLLRAYARAMGLVPAGVILAGDVIGVAFRVGAV